MLSGVLSIFNSAVQAAGETVKVSEEVDKKDHGAQEFWYHTFHPVKVRKIQLLGVGFSDKVGVVLACVLR